MTEEGYNEGDQNFELVEEPGTRYREFRSFKDLECWKSCREVRIWAATLVKTYPKEERFDLVSQIKRAARSTTANIAEGYGRFHYQENIQFCRVSRGSLYELMDHLSASVDEGLITRNQESEGLDLIQKCIAILNGYINFLERQKSK